MGKKLTIEFVKDKFLQKDLILLETTYINNLTPMAFKCLHHLDKDVQHTTYNSLFSSKYGCKYCAKEHVINALTLDYDTVYKIFEQKGCRLLETEYKGLYNEMKFICLTHPFEIQKTTLKNFKNNVRGCVYCGGRKHIKIIEKEFLERDLILLEKEYKDYHNQNLRYICKHHPEEIQQIKYCNFKEGSGCYFCGREKTIESHKFSLKYISDTLEKFGFIFIEDSLYKDTHDTKIKFRCKKHPETIQEDYFYRLARGFGCNFCASENWRKNYSGINSNNWKGGKSSLSEYLRKHIEAWKIDSFAHFKGTCVISGNKSQVLHHVYPFYQIVDEVLELTKIPLYSDIAKYTEQELEILSQICLNLHYKYGLGFPLTTSLHKEFHSIYGAKNFDAVDFYNFITNKLLIA